MVTMPKTKLQGSNKIAEFRCFVAVVGDVKKNAEEALIIKIERKNVDNKIFMLSLLLLLQAVN